MSAGRPPSCRRRGPDRGGLLNAWLSSWWLLLAVGTSGCAGTPWGETLSGSFPPPREPLSSTQTPPGPAAATTQAPEAAAEPSLPSPPPSPATPVPGAAPPRGAGPAAKVPGSPDPQSPRAKAPPTPVRAQPRPAPMSSSPYRVTLRLPGADPSAPAEAVTQALRAAGIAFEVETIERVRGGSASPSPASGEAVPGSPAGRPAPPP